jgi:hypothetical protein
MMIMMVVMVVMKRRNRLLTLKINTYAKENAGRVKTVHLKSVWNGESFVMYEYVVYVPSSE